MSRAAPETPNEILIAGLTPYFLEQGVLCLSVVTLNSFQGLKRCQN